MLVVFRPNEAFLHRYLQLSNTETAVRSVSHNSQLIRVRHQWLTDSNVLTQSDHHAAAPHHAGQHCRDGSCQHTQQTAISHYRALQTGKKTYITLHID